MLRSFRQSNKNNKDKTALTKTGGTKAEFNLLREVGSKASSIEELSDLVNEIVHITQSTLKAEASSVLLLDETQTGLVFDIAHGPVAGKLEKIKLDPEKSIAGWVANSGEPLVVHDVTKDPRFSGQVDESTGFITKSIMCVPLKVRGKIIGVVEVLNKIDESDFTPQDLEALLGVASIGAMGIEFKRAEEALRIRDQHYEALVGSLTDGVFQFRDGIITWCSESVEKIFGYSVDELVGKDVRELYPAILDNSEMENRISNAINTQGRFCDVANIKKKDKTTVDVEYFISEVHDKEPKEYVAVARDITERIRAETEKIQMEQQMQLAGRLTAVGELAASVAHELNNPLASIVGFTQLVESNEGLDEGVKKDIEKICREAKRASNITANLLSFARKHAPERALISINDVVEKSIELHDHRLKLNNIKLVLDLDRDLPSTRADSHEIQQVFINFLINAEQSMEEAHGKGNLCIKTQKVGEKIQITFEDDGKGIPEDDLKKIFDPFFTTKAEGHGTGLGLSICHGIIKNHNGNIYVQNNPGDGARFMVQIPIIASDEAMIESIISDFDDDSKD